MTSHVGLTLQIFLFQLPESWGYNTSNCKYCILILPQSSDAHSSPLLRIHGYSNEPLFLTSDRNRRRKTVKLSVLYCLEGSIGWMYSEYFLLFHNILLIKFCLISLIQNFTLWNLITLTFQVSQFYFSTLITFLMKEWGWLEEEEKSSICVVHTLTGIWSNF